MGECLWKECFVELSIFDILIFLLFFSVTIGTSLYKSRRTRTGEDFFLANRGLVWPLIGLSLISANISTEHFVGMSGQGASIGMAGASYEWIAAITLVLVALFFLPVFLRSGIFTIPEFLEYRYHVAARGIMSFYLLVIYVGVSISAVVYTGGLTLNTIFDVNLTQSIWIIGILAATYTTWGGLKAVAWADLFQGSALIIGGIITMVIALMAVGGLDSFLQANADKLHVVLPADHPTFPWTALIIGIWIPNFYYWGLNQFITQRTLGAKNLRQGQLGILLAAGIKLLIPFIMIFPGMMAVQLYKNQLTINDAAYPLLIKNLIPLGLKGFMFAAITGAVMGTLASMLNSAATLVTMDLYKRHWKKDAAPHTLVKMGRWITIAFVLIVCLIAPNLGNTKFQGIFNYIQEFHGYITPGILAAFAFGMIFKRAPAAAGITALLISVPIYGFLQWQYGSIAFLNRMAITFILIIIVMAVITVLKPLPEPKIIMKKGDMDLSTSPYIVWLGVLIIAITIGLYIIFW
jgi:SSS family solute:Na+ symporter